MIRLPVAYFPSVPWFVMAWNARSVELEVMKPYRKQAYTSRTYIRGPNRVEALVIPVERRGAHVPIRDKKISYAERWPVQHWRSLYFAYKNSPYFEYWGQEFHDLLFGSQTWLVDFLLTGMEKVQSLLNAEISWSRTATWVPDHQGAGDFRFAFPPQWEMYPEEVGLSPYQQVFEPFVPGLSILDLLFNLGPESGAYLTQSYRGEGRI